MAAPKGFEGEWYPIKLGGVARFFMGPLARWFFRNNGIGVGEGGIVLKGFGTQSFTWDDVEMIKPRKGTGAAGALLKAHLLVSKSKGHVNFPLYQTTDPGALIAALKAKGYLGQLEG